MIVIAEPERRIDSARSAQERDQFRRWSNEPTCGQVKCDTFEYGNIKQLKGRQRAKRSGRSMCDRRVLRISSRLWWESVLMTTSLRERRQTVHLANGLFISGFSLRVLIPWWWPISANENLERDLKAEPSEIGLRYTAKRTVSRGMCLPNKAASFLELFLTGTYRQLILVQITPRGLILYCLSV